MGKKINRTAGIDNLLPTVASLTSIKYEDYYEDNEKKDIDDSNKSHLFHMMDSEPAESSYYLNADGVQTIIKGPWKLIKKFNNKVESWVLVNTDEDPSESVDHSSSFPKLKKVSWIAGIN